MTTDAAGADDGENSPELFDVFRSGPIPPRQAGVPTIEIESVFGFAQTELDTMQRELLRIR